MRTEDFSYELPKALIARYPLPTRSSSRLLVLDPIDKTIEHGSFQSLPGRLTANDLLIFNNTKVVPARLYGEKETGGKVELLFERVIKANQALMQIRASKPPKANTRLWVADRRVLLEVVAKVDDMYLVDSLAEDWLTLLERYGEIPLPHYMERSVEGTDATRYQTVYASCLGAVAAPTAGLHFDAALMQELATIGVGMDYLTLHVGAGTFQPVRTASIDDHKMHEESFEISQSTCDRILATKARGGRVIAVGTTVVRALESLALQGSLTACARQTALFISPGFEFKVVDALITNFHLPQSTLLILVSAFAGRDFILEAYQTAVSEAYRFFSYGDAMFITRRSCEV